MRAEPFNPEKHTAVWDAFAAAAPMATFLHSRQFLSYHGDKFRDSSLLFFEGDTITGLLPAAESPANARVVVSHPGITYGGVLHHGMIGGSAMLEMLNAAREHYRTLGYEKLTYKAIPTFYHRVPSEEDAWALFAAGAKLERTDLGRTINLQAPLQWGDKRQRGLKKSEKAGVRTEHGHQHAEKLWQVTEDNLQRKHGVTPVHSLEDIRLLLKLCPESIEYIVAYLGEEALAGAMLFVTPTVIHVQYGSSSARGYEFDALEMVYYHAIDYAKRIGKHYFSFGISTEEEGKVMNDSLDRFKKKFSAGGTCYHFYGLAL